MTSNPASARTHGLASFDVPATAKRSRGVYRRQVTAARAGAPNVGPEARRAAAVTLEVLAGVRRRELAVSQRELARHQALAQTT
jgi:hypothetical protein